MAAFKTETRGNNVIRLPYRFRKKNEPQFYLLTCPKCGFRKQYELAKNYTVVRTDDAAAADTPEVVDELPTACPACGAAPPEKGPHPDQDQLLNRFNTNNKKEKRNKLQK